MYYTNKIGLVTCIITKKSTEAFSFRDQNVSRHAKRVYFAPNSASCSLPILKTAYSVRVKHA